MRRLFLGIAVAATALAPSYTMADDTQIADFIQSRLQVEQQQGRLRGFNVDMQVEKGTVWFKGVVSNAQQEALILKTAQEAGSLGVIQIVDDIEIATGPAQAGYTETPSSGNKMLQPVAYQQKQDEQQKAGTPQRPMTQASYAPNSAAKPMPNQGYMDPAVSGQIMTGEVISGDPLPFASAGGPMPMGMAAPMGMGMGEPLPMQQPGMGGPSGAPNLPGYAWPGYAAHPNYGAVSYPKQYSASAWPYIGPFYPYPQVPLGWRKVSLEWDDGFWHLDFHDKTRH